jgi:hypothetical protein
MKPHVATGLMQYTFCSFLTLGFTTFLAGQVATPALPQPLSPQSAYISSQRYVNAFFGFSLPLSSKEQLASSRPAGVENDKVQFLFFAQIMKDSSFGLPKPGELVIEITPSATSSLDEAKSVLSSDPDVHENKLIQISGKQFWRTRGEKKTNMGKMTTCNYATNMNGYILRFLAVGYSSSIVDQFSKTIEAMTFFDPTKATEVAGPNSRPYAVQ